MALTAGARLGPYEILSILGVGGMGEVYRARDTKLNRDVAIKVLPALFAGDPDRVARFKREAQVLAALNHPHIAHIHGFEDADGIHALILELVDGPTLAEMIAGSRLQASGSGSATLPEAQSPKPRARGLPLDDALNIARQIAEALEAAHEQGIVHRDLKPANIKVRDDGTVKVLDFGLAKVLEAGGAREAGEAGGAGRAGQAGGLAGLTQSPTFTSPAMLTDIGVILGTAAYMSPEQAKGRPADKRSDVWAFGAVFYEMLTGRRAFEGEDLSDTLANVLKSEPDWGALPADVPPYIRTLVQRCLTKDRRQRMADMSVALFVMAEAASLAPQFVPQRRVSWLWPAAVAALLAIASGLALVHFRETPPAQQSLRFQIPPPGSAPAQMFALSPDGKYLAFVASDDGPSRLWVRAMDALDARALAGTNGASFPFWSPDSQNLGFFAQGKLRKIAVAGGPPQPLCDVADGRGGSWNRDGVIIFSPVGIGTPIFRVSSAGGQPTPVTKVADGDNGGHRFPAFLPDGRHFLYHRGSSKGADGRGIFVDSLDGGSPVRLLPDGSNALYAPPTVLGGSGFLLFRNGEDTLMAQPFDATGLKTSGDMFPIAEHVAPGSGQILGFGAFSTATDGTLVYQAGGASANRELVWVDRTGKRLRIATKPALVMNPYSLSPDEKTVAMTISMGSGSNSELWLQDLERDVPRKFTFRTGLNMAPVWSPNGSQVMFTFPVTGGYSRDIYQKSVSGSGREVLILNAGVNARPTDWSTDGKMIVYQEVNTKTGSDLWLLPVEGSRTPVPYLRTPADERNAQFFPGAPGGPKWMAYESNESAQNQIYVQAIPATSGSEHLVSTTSGTFPRWRQDGQELYYMSADGKLVARSMTLGASLEPGTSQELFTNAGMSGFVPSRDGQRFLINVPAGGDAAAAAPITVVTNWQAGLKK